MKPTTLLLALSLPLLNSCGDHDHDDHDHGKDGHSHDHGKGGHSHDKDGENHAKHDDKDGHKHDKDGHNHAGGDHDHSDPDHNHDHCNVTVGPNGGRLIKGDHSNIEFIVTDDNTFTLSFLNDKNEPADHADQAIILVDNLPVETTLNGTVITSETVELSKPVKVILSITSHGHETTIPPFTVAKGNCPDCKNKKYACTCGNHEH